MDLADPRVDRGKNFCLKEMVMLAISGTICGADTWADIERFCRAHQAWFEQYLKLPRGIPSHDTFGRATAKCCVQRRWIRRRFRFEWCWSGKVRAFRR